jgi:non-heme chloroperoxidase
MRPSFFAIFTLPALGAFAMSSQHTKSVKTGDGVRLQYSQTGPPSGQQLLFLTGWRQAALEWRKQTDYFSSAGFRVTALDFRGHGESEEPDFGYRVSRFAADLNDVLTQLNLKKVTIIGHSMGCSVAWAWWDQYPEARKRVAKFVFVDQAATTVKDPHWTDEQAADLAAIFTPNTPYDLAADMAEQLGPLVRSMFTPNVSESDFEWVLSQNKKMSDAHSGTLLIDHASKDWRDVLPRITVPSLVIAGAVSVFPAKGIEGVARQIPGAESYTFTAEEKGSHFMFWENPERFNQVVEAFVTK